MTTIVLRASKGSSLTNEEVDGNFSNLNAGKQEVLEDGVNIKTLNGSSLLGTGDLVISSGVGTATTLFLNSTSAFADNLSLTAQPTGLAESSISVVCNSTINGGVNFLERYVSEPLGGTTLDGGTWKFNTYASVSSNTGLSEIITRVNKRVALSGVTVSTSGSGGSRTMTASSGVFTSEMANTSVLLASLVETSNQTLWISGFTNSTTVTVAPTDAGFVNITDVPLEALYHLLFSVTTSDISGASAGYYRVEVVKPGYSITPTDRLVVAYFGKTDSGSNKTITLYKDGSTHYSNIETPIIHRHNQMAGLNEGDFQHITAAEKLAIQTGSQEEALYYFADLSDVYHALHL